MGNSFFRFKQFTVYQDRCALKVCTDACLFGAWTADILDCKLQIANLQYTICNVLDIGTGTGLLSLMLAQKITAPIDAVEVERADCLQAQENFAQSAWSDQLNAVWANIRDHQTSKQYDCIISNPPFFENDLLPPGANDQRAKHNSYLTLRQLFTEADRLLAANGIFAVLLPFHRKQEALELAAARQLHPLYSTDVQQTPEHGFSRSLLLFGRHAAAAPVHTTMAIQRKGAYTDAFTALLKDYYLYL